MHHLIFIPGTQSTAPQILEDVGLGAHLPGANFTPSETGPTGGPGVIVSWRIDDCSYKPAQQQWITAVQSRSGHPAGRYWVGVRRDKLPSHEDLLRSTAIFGKAVKLGDGGYWVVPPLQKLPCTFELTDQGEYQQVIRSEYNYYYIETLRQVAKIRDNRGTFELMDLIRIAETGLAFNYRLVPELSNHLRLFTTESLIALFSAITGVEKQNVE